MKSGANNGIDLTRWAEVAVRLSLNEVVEVRASDANQSSWRGVRHLVDPM